MLLRLTMMLLLNDQVVANFVHVVVPACVPVIVSVVALGVATVALMIDNVEPVLPLL